MKYLIFEPHSDDAWLSLGNTIINWLRDSNEVQIITCSIQESQYSEIGDGASNYPWETFMLEAIYRGIRAGLIMAPDLHWKYRVDGLEKAGMDSDEFYVSLYKTRIGQKHFQKIKDKIVEMANVNRGSGWTIIAPLGIQHPYHHVIHTILRDNVVPDMYYLDQPYAAKKKNKEIIDKKLEGFVLNTMTQNSGNEKKKVLKSVFPSQSRYYSSILCDIQEEIYAK